MNQIKPIGQIATLVLCGWLSTIAAWAQNAAPAEHTLTAPTTPLEADANWGKEPVENLTDARGRIVLNGVWNLMPGMESSDAYAKSTWGAIRVPGSWLGLDEQGLRRPGMVRRGGGAAWQQKNWEQKPPHGVWYARTIETPAAWAGRAFDLDMSWLESYGDVWVDDVYCGRIEKPHGTLDITAGIKPGTRQTLRIKMSVGASEAVVTAMGIGFVKQDGALPYRQLGLLGDVVLFSRPRGAYVSDVFVQPSTRQKALGLDIEFTGVTQAGTVTLTAEMYDEKGNLETTLRGQAPVTVAPTQRVVVSLPWGNPRLWDYKQPNLYIMRLKAEGAGLADNYYQEFGFREVWIEGRKVMLNGREIRLRMCGGFFGRHGCGIPEVVNLTIDAIMDAGYNILELWPEQPYQTTRWNLHQEVLARCADRKGFFFTGITSHAVNATGARRGPAAQKAWDEDPAVREKFRRDTELVTRRLRNHPSVLMWGSTGNFGMHSQDQNPRFLGASFETFQRTSNDADQNRRYYEAWKIQKAVDPTRPVFWHASTIGDIHTINWYLNVIPLQEREEWLSHWIEHGTRPVTGAEFGLPLETYTFQRMRSYDGMGHWEYLSTEYMADMLGEEAYRLEGDHMWRWALHPRVRVGGGKDDPEIGAFMHSGAHMRHPDYKSFHVWTVPWVENTWRSWRTWGMTVLPIPWGEGRGWYVGEGRTRFKLSPWQPGQLGGWVEDVALSALPKMPPGETRGRIEFTTRQEALIRNGQDTLAWIAGPQAEFTAKDHSFWAGDTLAKSLVVINDTRATQRYAFQVSVRVGDQVIHETTEEGRVEQAGTKFLPIRVTLPQVATKTDGSIVIRGTIETGAGPRTHEDTFAFRVFPQSAPTTLKTPVRVWDPVGKTTALLKTLGLDPQPWDGKPADGLLIVGREALSRGKGMGDLTGVLKAGGRVLVMAQHPDWTRDTLDLRVAQHLTRRVWRTMPEHPVVAGLDDLDLRDWSGVSTLVDPYPHYKHEFKPPFYGWRWGNRGALSSGAIETPHNAGWRPLLSCFFDQGWSPLLELDWGGGRLIWNTLDFEDFVPRDPAATVLARNLLAYAATAPLAPRSARTVTIGLDDTQAEIIKETSLIHQPVTELPAEPCLALLGRKAALDAAAIERFARAGGKVVLLAPDQAEHAFGAKLKTDPDAGKYAPLPNWAELRSLHGGNFRTRGPVKNYIVLEGGDGVELACNGQLGRKAVGQGVVLWFMPASDRLDLPPRPWMLPNEDLRHVRRFTRWNEHRALVRILANLGAEFELDAGVPRLRSLADTITLAGAWRVKPIELRPVNRDFGKRLPVPPVSDAVRQAAAPQTDDSAWEMVMLPGLWETFREQDGEAVFRRNVSVSSDWAGHDLRLTLGKIRDADTVFWNGVEIGATVGHAANRVYTIPANQVRAGVNVLAVRVVNNYLWGGFAADDPGELGLQPAADRQRIGRNPFGPWRCTAYYHFDYNVSDDPFRYWRW